MGRNVGCHTDRNTARSIYQKVRETGRKNGRFFFFSVIVVLHVNGVFLKISEHFHRDLRHTCFGISHCRSTVTIHGAEVAVSVNQYSPHIPWLCHVYKRTVNGRVTVRVIFTHGVTDNTRTFLVRFVRTVIHFIHGEQNSALYRLQSVTNIRKRTCDDD